ncbi:tol-pal system YbgF family protein, partial [Paenibacillus sp. KS1]|uniref:tetratricopeptide repeat protein n=1 Tax=Paenibacillus sp. KS1 TaxID=1849249 RepID=UPI000A62C3FC
MTNLNPSEMEESDLIEASTSSDDHASLTESVLNSVSDQVSTSSDPFNERLTLAIQLYLNGVAGSAAAVHEAHQILEQLHADDDLDPLVGAYYGSTMILIARDKTEASDKLKWSKQGLKMLDNAVAADPHNSTIRLLRGKSSYNLPEQYFHRTKTVIEDFTHVLNTPPDTLDTEELIYELGEAYSKIGQNQDAATHFRKLESQTQNSAWKQLSKQKLQELEGKPAVEKIPNKGPSSILIEATRTVGNALLTLFGNEKEYEKAKEKAEDREKRRAKERAEERAEERARERAKE